jgi:hypothetical protein
MPGWIDWLFIKTPGPPTPGSGAVCGRACSWPPGSFTERGRLPNRVDPAQATVDVVLDRGTDRERRCRFNRLILPGSPPAIPGTFDVDP